MVWFLFIGFIFLVVLVLMLIWFIFMFSMLVRCLCIVGMCGVILGVWVMMVVLRLSRV